MTEQDRLVDWKGGVRVRRERSKGPGASAGVFWRMRAALPEWEAEGGGVGRNTGLLFGSATSQMSARTGGEKLGK